MPLSEVRLGREPARVNKVHYADKFVPTFGRLWEPIPPRSFWDDKPVEMVAKYLQLRKDADEWAIKNPVGAGWILPSWRDVQEAWSRYAIIVLLGGNRSSKSTLASRLVVSAAANIPESEVRCYHVTADRSIEQQAMIYDALPLSTKSLPTKKGIAHSLQFSQKNGFTDSICILPPLPGYRKGGSIKFGNYSQYAQNPQITEGFKSHVIWCDEECPQKMFDTLLYRNTDFHGRMILSFTTLQGWSPLVQDLLAKTKTLKTKYAPLLKREIPVMRESLSRPGCVIFNFFTEDNAFIDTSDFINTIRSRPADEILARAYGIPTKSMAGVFPGFDKEVNVIPHEKLPWIKNEKYRVTRYMAIDPAGSKNWFMLWVAVDPAGTFWVYREWPDDGDWAIPGSTVEGKPGPAQKGSKKGIKDYVELIRGAEGEEKIYERFIDPRMGAAERQSEDGATTIISDLDLQDMTVIPAPGVDIDNGLQLINNLLSYDEKKPIDSMNGPKLYISDRCHNLIYAMQEYTAKGGSTEACKDPVDALRYICVSNPEYYDIKDTTQAAGTFSY